MLALAIPWLLWGAEPSLSTTVQARPQTGNSLGDHNSWHRLTRDHTVVLHNLPASERAERLLALAIRTREEIASELGVTSREPLVLYLCRDESSFNSAAGRNPEDGQVGVATPGSRRIVVLAFRGGRPTPLNETIVHEIAHIVLAEAAQGDMPFWFQEGFAQYQSHQLTVPEAFYLALVGVAGRLVPLSEIDREFPYGTRLSRLAYAQSLDAFTYLSGRVGLGGIGTLARGVARHGSFAHAFRRVYGAGVREFEMTWRASLMQRYRWVLLTSGWIPVLLIVTLVAGILKWRRSRRTLARWEAQEHESEGTRQHGIE